MIAYPVLAVFMTSWNVGKWHLIPQKRSRVIREANRKSYVAYSEWQQCQWCQQPFSYTTFIVHQHNRAVPSMSLAMAPVCLTVGHMPWYQNGWTSHKAVNAVWVNLSETLMKLQLGHLCHPNSDAKFAILDHYLWIQWLWKLSNCTIANVFTTFFLYLDTRCHLWNWNASR